MALEQNLLYAKRQKQRKNKNMHKEQFSSHKSAFSCPRVSLCYPCVPFSGKNRGKNHNESFLLCWGNVKDMVFLEFTKIDRVENSAG
jgi:hypothetical protein